MTLSSAAAHGHTAAEVIYDRADAEKPFMGLTSFKGELPCINDIKIAKNYLTADGETEDICSGQLYMTSLQLGKYRSWDDIFLEKYRILELFLFIFASEKRIIVTEKADEDNDKERQIPQSTYC